MNLLIKETYQKLSNRADYNNNMMRITNLDNKKDPINMGYGTVFNTVEIRKGNYYVKQSANLVFEKKNCHKQLFLDNFEGDNEKMKTIVTHLDCKLTKKTNMISKLYEKYDKLMENHLELYEEHEMRLSELKNKQKLLE